MTIHKIKEKIYEIYKCPYSLRILIMFTKIYKCLHNKKKKFGMKISNVCINITNIQVITTFLLLAFRKAVDWQARDRP